MIDAVEAVLGCAVPRETGDLLARYAAMLIEENGRQNLISRSTIADLGKRHLADSAQLMADGKTAGRWADIGSGAGLPGVVLAILGVESIALIEPRRLRAEFLQRVVGDLGLTTARVVNNRAEVATGRFDSITARAVAPATDILWKTRHLAHKDTRYLLMKGRSAQSELEAVRAAWHGDFRLVPSRTDREAAIIVATGVRPRGGS